MEKFAKWIAGGVGWVMLGPLGGVLGFMLGSLFENKGGQLFSESRQGPTTTGDFALSLLVLVAAVMKADGKVLRSELEYVKAYFVRSFGESAAGEAIMMLRDLLKQDINIREVSGQIRSRLDYSSRLQMMHFLFGIANADGRIDASELNTLRLISGYLGLSGKDTDSIMSMFVDNTEASYKILGITRDASDEDIKKAYRTMAMKYHPDKVSYLGEDFRAAANEKFQSVNEAYENIKKERGIN